MIKNQKIQQGMNIYFSLRNLNRKQEKFIWFSLIAHKTKHLLACKTTLMKWHVTKLALMASFLTNYKVKTWIECKKKGIIMYVNQMWKIEDRNNNWNQIETKQRLLRRNNN